MRTTVEIPDALYRQLKSAAALQGCSVKTLIVRGVESQLNGTGEAKKQRITLPLIKSKLPGRLKLSNRKINEILFP
jgi:hypothetical protein